MESRPILPCPENGHKSIPPASQEVLKLRQFCSNKTADGAICRMRPIRGRDVCFRHSERGPEAQAASLFVRRGQRLLRTYDEILACLVEPDPRLQTLLSNRSNIARLLLQSQTARESISISLSSSSSQEEEKDKRPPLVVSPKTRTRVKLEGTDLPPGFQRFWSVWPNRVAKKAALKAWLEIKPSLEIEDQILEAVKLQLENNFAGDNRRRIPYPATWLNAERWTDEIIEPVLTREQQLDRAYRRLCEEESADAQS